MARIIIIIIQLITKGGKLATPTMENEVGCRNDKNDYGLVTATTITIIVPIPSVVLFGGSAMMMNSATRRDRTTAVAVGITKKTVKLFRSV